MNILKKQTNPDTVLLVGFPLQTENYQELQSSSEEQVYSPRTEVKPAFCAWQVTKSLVTICVRARITERQAGKVCLWGHWPVQICIYVCLATSRIPHRSDVVVPSSGWSESFQPWLKNLAERQGQQLRSLTHSLGVGQRKNFESSLLPHILAAPPSPPQGILASKIIRCLPFFLLSHAESYPLRIVACSGR